MKKIALLHWTVSPFSLESMGGLEVMEHGLLKKLNEKHSATLFTKNLSQERKNIRKIRHISFLKKYDFFYYLQFIIKNISADYLIGFNTPFLSLFSLRKTIVIFHNFIKIKDGNSFLPLYSLFSRRYHRCTFAFCSNFLRNQFLKEYPHFPKEKTFIIFNALEKKEIVTRNKGFSKIKSIVYMGQWNHDKGFDILIDAIQLLRKKRADFTLFLLGGKNLWKQQKKEKIVIPKKNYIVNLGILSHQKTLKFIQNKDILVVPSRWSEPFGLVALEGLAKGMIVVTSGNGGLRDVISNHNGLIVPDINPQRLAKALNEVLNYDINVINHLRREGYKKIVENFTWDIYLKKLETIFKNLN